MIIIPDASRKPWETSPRRPDGGAHAIYLESCRELFHQTVRTPTAQSCLGNHSARTCTSPSGKQMGGNGLANYCNSDNQVVLK